MRFRHTLLGKALMRMPGGDRAITLGYRIVSHNRAIEGFETAFRTAKETTGIQYSPQGGRWPWPMPFPKDHYLEVLFPDGEKQVVHLTVERAFEDINGMYGIESAHYARAANTVIPASGLTVDENFTMLDCACGSGYGSNYLQKTLGCRVSGVDVDPAMVKYAAKRYASTPMLRYLHDDAAVLKNFEDTSLDAIVSVETIEHVPDADVVLANYRRVMKPKGVLYITSPDATDRPGTLLTTFHVREWTHPEFDELLRRHFHVVDTHRLDGYIIGICRPTE